MDMILQRMSFLKPLKIEICNIKFLRHVDIILEKPCSYIVSRHPKASHFRGYCKTLLQMFVGGERRERGNSSGSPIIYHGFYLNLCSAMFSNLVMSNFYFHIAKYYSPPPKLGALVV